MSRRSAMMIDDRLERSLRTAMKSAYSLDKRN